MFEMNDILNPVLVVGAGRSGTSATAGVLQACGMELGLGGKNRLREHPHIKRIIRSVLRESGITFDYRTFNNPINPMRNSTQFREDVINAFPEAAQAEVWGWKCIETLLMLRMVIKAFPDAVFIYCKRDPELIAESAMRASFMKVRHTKEEWIEWASVFQKRCEILKIVVDKFLEFRPFIDPWSRVTDYVKLPYKKKEVEKWIQQDKYHLSLESFKH